MSQPLNSFGGFVLRISERDKHAARMAITRLHVRLGYDATTNFPITTDQLVKYAERFWLQTENGLELRDKLPLNWCQNFRYVTVRLLGQQINLAASSYVKFPPGSSQHYGHDVSEEEFPDIAATLRRNAEILAMLDHAKAQLSELMSRAKSWRELFAVVPAVRGLVPQEIANAHPARDRMPSAKRREILLEGIDVEALTVLNARLKMQEAAHNSELVTAQRV